MPAKKLRAKRAKAAVPESSQKITDSCTSLNLSQSELAKRLGSSAMAVSRWERGIQQVPADIYVRLGNLAGDPLCWCRMSFRGVQVSVVVIEDYQPFRRFICSTLAKRPELRMVAEVSDGLEAINKAEDSNRT